MTERILGEAGPKRRRRFHFVFLPIILGAALALMMAGGAQAVHDEGVFGLDGNAITGGTPCTNAAQTLPAGCEPANPLAQGYTNEDWDKVFDGTTTAVSHSFVTDSTLSGGLAGAGDTILQGGATKDINDLPSWLWKETAQTSVQDKDDIEHAYAAQYVKDKSGTGEQCGTFGPTANCVLLYFGADRFSNSGDSVMGFWFYKNKVETVGPDANGNGTFTGVHTARDTSTDPITRGDILVVSDFRSGGKAPSIQVYEWVNSGGSASTHLDQIGGGTSPVPCTQAPPEKNNQPPIPPVQDNDNFCATANQFVVTSPWAFTPKANSGGTPGPDGGTAKFGIAEFMEGGINMTALGLGNECFNTFEAETRSAHSVTSTLSDFTLGSFGSCGASLATQSSKTTLEIGDAAPTDTATINVSSSGGNPPAPTGDVNFYLCGPSTTQITSCDPTGLTAFDTVNLSGATKVGNDYSVTSSAPTITSAGYYCFTATWEGDNHYTDGPYEDDGTDECFQVTPKTPGISTQVSNAGPVVPGTAVSDTATIGGLATPSNSTQGTITFRAYGPDDATCATAVYTSVVNPPTFSGNGSYNSFTDGDGGAFAPTGPGVYRWRAFYAPASGDVNNLSASTGCNDANESFTVEQFQPTQTTAQTWTVKDSITVSVTGGGNLAGTAHFELHKTTDCSDAAIDTQNVPVSGASGTTVSTTVNANTTFTTSQTTLYWKVSYTSTNPAQKDIAATCTENSSVTIIN
jgi:hypothetical protein